MSKTISPGARRLSSNLSRKVLLTCARCNLRVQYDRDGLLLAGGDRGLAEPSSTGCRAEGLSGAVSGRQEDDRGQLGLQRKPVASYRA